jgi:hypothetical protein
VPKHKIKLGGRRKKGSSDDDEDGDGGGGGGGKDSDVEFKEMLKEAETAMADDDVQITAEKAPKKPKGKAKMKIGNKFKKKGKKKKDLASKEAEHQEYCDVCQRGGGDYTVRHVPEGLPPVQPGPEAGRGAGGEVELPALREERSRQPRGER